MKIKERTIKEVKAIYEDENNKELEYQRTFFNIDKTQSEITDDLIIEFKEDGNRFAVYNQKRVSIDDSKIDELVDKVISITNNQGTINEYIDDCGATLKISYENDTADEFDRGFGNEEADIGTLFDDFIYNNIKNG